MLPLVAFLIRSAVSYYRLDPGCKRDRLVRSSDALSGTNAYREVPFRSSAYVPTYRLPEKALPTTLASLVKLEPSTSTVEPLPSSICQQPTRVGSEPQGAIGNDRIGICSRVVACDGICDLPAGGATEAKFVKCRVPPGPVWRRTTSSDPCCIQRQIDRIANIAEPARGAGPGVCARAGPRDRFQRRWQRIGDRRPCTALGSMVRDLDRIGQRIAPAAQWRCHRFS